MSFGTRALPPLGAPPGRSPVRSPKGLVTPLTVLFGVCAATRLLTLAAQVNRYLVLDASVAGGAADTAAAWRLYTMALGPALLAMAVTAVVFVVWFHRVRVNAGVLAPQMFRHGAGWAIGMWFVPVVGWTVLPYLTAVRVWAACASRLPGSAAKPVSAAPVAAWAGAFGAAMAVSFASNRLAQGSWILAGVRDAALVGAASDLLFVVAAALAVVLVRRLSAMQEA